MSAENPIIQPPSKLLLPAPDSADGYAFPLQTSAWLKMQDVVAKALAFPLTADDFTNSYGGFSDQGQVIQAVTILG